MASSPSILIWHTSAGAGSTPKSKSSSTITLLSLASPCDLKALYAGRARERERERESAREREREEWKPKKTHLTYIYILLLYINTVFQTSRNHAKNLRRQVHQEKKTCKELLCSEALVRTSTFRRIFASAHARELFGPLRMHCFMPRLFACLASLTGSIWNLERTYLVMLSKVEREINHSICCKQIRIFLTWLF